MGALPWILFSLFFLILIVLFILLFVFWIYMIVDCAKRRFSNETDKVIWILILVLLGWLGAIIYYFVIKKTKR